MKINFINKARYQMIQVILNKFSDKYHRFSDKKDEQFKKK